MCEFMHIAESVEQAGGVMPEPESPTFQRASGLCIPRGYQPETSGSQAGWRGSPACLDSWKSERSQVGTGRLSGGKKGMYTGKPDAS